MDKIKCFRLVLTDELTPDGKKKHKINYMAFTASPAIEEMWIAMNGESQEVKFETISEEKRIVMSPYMIADKPILRMHPKTKEPFFVVLDAENIEKIMFDIYNNDYHKNIDDNHKEKDLSGICMFQSWIINRALGINPPTAWSDLADGSAMGVWKVNNESVWKEIKAGTFKGVSIEGFLKLEEMEDITEDELTEILDSF